MSISGLFDTVDHAPADAILSITAKYKADSHPNKLCLGVGAYRDESLKPYVFSVVKEAEAAIIADALDKEYSPISGCSTFTCAASSLVFGRDSPAASRMASLQAVGGTGAVRIAAEVIRSVLPSGTRVLLPDSTWANHPNILSNAGFPACDVVKYRYFDPLAKAVDLVGMLEDMHAAPEGSVIILHACCHNPTGVDPTPAQWSQIFDAARARRMVLLFDSAYQGFGTGDVDLDAFSIREAVNRGFEMLVAQSFSKNMGLYGERVGCLHIVANSESAASALASVAAVVVRRCYSNPPKHGARIVAKVLTDPGLLKAWKEELKAVYTRISDVRKTLHGELLALGLTWDHLTTQTGMFSFSGLSPEHVDMLMTDHHVYMLRSGRISLSGLNGPACRYLASAIATVLQRTPLPKTTMAMMKIKGVGESSSPAASSPSSSVSMSSCTSPKSVSPLTIPGAAAGSGSETEDE